MFCFVLFAVSFGKFVTVRDENRLTTVAVDEQLGSRKNSTIGSKESHDTITPEAPKQKWFWFIDGLSIVAWKLMLLKFAFGNYVLSPGPGAPETLQEKVPMALMQRWHVWLIYADLLQVY